MRATKPTASEALRRAGILLGAALVLTAGCDAPPGPLRTRLGRKVKLVTVDSSADPAEVQGVRDLQDARVRYEHALKALRAYYERTGAITKEEWAEKELKNLQDAQTWQYAGQGAEQPPAPPAQVLVGVTEAALVEQVIAARRDWKDALAALDDHYRQKGLGFKARAIDNTQRRFDVVDQYDYLLSVEIPPATLRPTQFDEKANALFEQALKTHRWGKPLPLWTDYRAQRRALIMFRDLVYQHPNSTKIAESAYYIAEIYKEYFDENVRAVHWYERAWQWDRNIQLPARSQAAYVYDIRLSNYGKALELYHEVIKYEQFSPNRVRYAYQRIEELNRKRR